MCTEHLTLKNVAVSFTDFCYILKFDSPAKNISWDFYFLTLESFLKQQLPWRFLVIHSLLLHKSEFRNQLFALEYHLSWNWMLWIIAHLLLYNLCSFATWSMFNITVFSPFTVLTESVVKCKIGISSHYVAIFLVFCWFWILMHLKTF